MVVAGVDEGNPACADQPSFTRGRLQDEGGILLDAHDGQSGGELGHQAGKTLLTHKTAAGIQLRPAILVIPMRDENQGQVSLAEPTDVETQVYPLLARLLQRLWDRRVRIRMVQVKLSNVYSGFSQMDLFGVKQKQRDLAMACQAIRERFGPKAMMRKHDWEEAVSV